MDLKTYIREISKNKEIIEEFDRLRGTNLSLKGTALELEIDRSSGRLGKDIELWLEFCSEMYQNYLRSIDGR